MKLQYNIDFWDDQSIDPDTSLQSIDWDRKEIQALCQDQNFMKEWLNYEYFTDN
ncbi:MAG: hypothetical protein U1E02_42655 [Hydrogenophaga sp.]|nr:hypothetical protein [Hydrogenophaga sp.]